MSSPLRPTTGDRRERLNEAMWSVYLHTTMRNGLKQPVVSRDLPFAAAMRLDDAVGLLQGDFDEHDGARRAIALKKLVAANFHRLDRLTRLIGPDAAEALLEQIRGLGRTIRVDVQSLEDLLSPLALQKLLDMLEALAPLVPGCEIQSPSCVACHDGLTLNTTVTGKVKVRRSVSELAKIVDPRAWSACNPYFLETYRALDQPIDYPKDPASEATPLGTPWTGPLYEKVQAGPVLFENVLEVTAFTVTASELLMTYEELFSKKTQFPTHSINGGIEIDEGYTKATDIGSGWSALEFVKTVRFVDLTPGTGAEIDYGELLNYWAPAILCLWVQDKAESGPCCTP